MIIEDNGKLRDADKVAWAEKITETRQKKDVWTVIDELVKVWAEVAPEDEAAMKINVSQYRETLVDKEFGRTLNGQDQERRFVLAFPKSLYLMIRSQYKAEEFPMDSKFFKEFAKRYPAFRVAEKN
jgi:hypothetical protein